MHDFEDYPCKRCNGKVLDKDFWIRFYNRHHVWFGTVLVIVGVSLLLASTSTQ
jgi:hypothetical protein